MRIRLLPPQHVVFIAVLAMAVTILSGCGVYSGTSGRVDDSLKRVSVQYLENLTSEPNIGVELADDIEEAIQLDNTLKVTDEGNADTIVTGKVMRYVLKQVAARNDLTVTEYQVQIAVVLTMTVRATGEKIFDKKRFTGTGNYSLEDNATSEDLAQEEAAAEIVRDILAMVVEDW